MPLSGLDRLFWIAGFLGHGLLLAVLVGKRLATRFPFFTALTANSVLRTLLLFAVFRRGSEQSYFLVYSAELAVDCVLQSLVVWELARHIFRPLGRWAPDARRGLLWLAAGSALVAGLLMWLAAPNAGDLRLQWVNKVNFFTSSLMSELFLGLLLLSVSSGLPWRTHAARIAYGLGAYCLVDILIEAAQTLVGKGLSEAAGTGLTHLRMTVYLGSLLYWIVTLPMPVPEPRPLPPQLRKDLLSAQSRLAYDLFTFRSWRP